MLLRKSDGNTHIEEVFITPKKGNQHPYWKKVEKGEEEESEEHQPKQPDEPGKKRKKKADVPGKKRKKKVEDPSKQHTAEPDDGGKRKAAEPDSSKHSAQPDDSGKRKAAEDSEHQKAAQQNDSSKQSSQTESGHQQAEQPDVETVKNATKKFCKQFKTNDELMAELRHRGIPWQENAHQGINIKNVKLALNAAFANRQYGFDVNNIPARQTAPAPVNIEAEKRAAETKHIKSMVKLIYQSFDDVNDYYDAIKKLGISWRVTASDNITRMNANAAVTEAVRNGLDIGELYTRAQQIANEKAEQKANEVMFTPVKQGDDIVPGPVQVAQESKDDVQKLYATCKSDSEFYDKLRKLGIKWKYCRNPNTNIMRAMMAASHRVDEGLNLFTGEMGQHRKVPSTLTPEQKIGGVPRPLPIPKEAKDLVKQIHKSCKDRYDFLDKLRAVGIKWTEHDHRGINLMRAKMLASQLVNAGFDLVGAIKQQFSDFVLKPTEDQNQQALPFMGQVQTSTQPPLATGQQSEPTVDELEQKVADTEVKAAQAEAKAANAEVKAAKKKLKAARKRASKKTDNQLSLFDETGTEPAKPSVDAEQIKQNLLALNNKSAEQTTTESTTTETKPKKTRKKKATIATETTETTETKPKRTRKKKATTETKPVESESSATTAEQPTTGTESAEKPKKTRKKKVDTAQIKQDLLKLDSKPATDESDKLSESAEKPKKTKTKSDNQTTLDLGESTESDETKPAKKSKKSKKKSAKKTDNQTSLFDEIVAA